MEAKYRHNMRRDDELGRQRYSQVPQECVAWGRMSVQAPQEFDKRRIEGEGRRFYHQKEKGVK